MTERRVPRSVSEQRLAIINIVKQSESPITGREIENQLPSELKRNAAKGMSQMKHAGWVASRATVSGHKGYVLGAHGKHVLKHIKSINVVPFQKKGPYRGRDKAVVEQESTHQFQINLSSTAEALSDNISAILHENQQYRDLMLKIHTTIGNALQLNKEEISNDRST